MNKNKWFLNGGRGSGRTIRLLCETYENKIADLEDKLANADYQLEGRDNEIKELEAQIEKMKCCGNCEWRAKDVCNGNNTCGLKEWKFDEGRR